MVEEKNKEKPKVTNEISDHTGQYDARFILWREFCSRHNVPVETLPSDLSGETKKSWEALKESRLKKEE